MGPGAGDEGQLGTLRIRREVALMALRSDAIFSPLASVDLSTMDDEALARLFEAHVLSLVRGARRAAQTQTPQKEQELTQVQDEIARRRTDIDRTMKRLAEREQALKARVASFRLQTGDQRAAEGERNARRKKRGKTLL